MYSKIAFASSTRVFQRRVLRSSTCIRDQKASIMRRPESRNQTLRNRATSKVSEKPGMAQSG